MCRVTCYNLPYKRHRVTVVGYSLTLFLVSKFFRKSDFNNNGSLNNLITLPMGNKNKSCILIGYPSRQDGPPQETKCTEQTYKVCNLWTMWAMKSQKAAEDR